MCLVGHITPCPRAQRLGGYNLKNKQKPKELVGVEILKFQGPACHAPPRPHSFSTWGLFISQSVMGGPGPPQYRLL